MNSYSLVYDVNQNRWWEFSDFDVGGNTILTGIGVDAIMNLFVSSGGEAKLYPGNDQFPGTAVAVTKKYFLGGRSLKSIRIKFEGSLTLKIRVYNSRFESGVAETEINDLESEVWRGLIRGLKGDWVEFELSGADAIEWIEYEIRSY